MGFVSAFEVGRPLTAKYCPCGWGIYRLVTTVRFWCGTQSDLNHKLKQSGFHGVAVPEIRPTRALLWVVK